MKTVRIPLFLLLLILCSLFFACAPQEQPTASPSDADTPTPEQTTSASQSLTGPDTPFSPSAPSAPTATEEPTGTDDPTTGEPTVRSLVPTQNGKAPGVPDGSNPFVSGNRLFAFFDLGSPDAGLILDEDTVVDYLLVKSDRTEISGSTPLVASEDCVKNEYGYIGVCLDVDYLFEKGDRMTVNLSFKDRSGAEYSFKKTLVVSLSMIGLDSSAFSEVLGDAVTTTVSASSIQQTGTVNGTDFRLTVDLAKWAGNTSVEQIVVCSKLFWQVYPRMYARFGEKGESPTSVTLAVENEGYGIASAGGARVHLHDVWLHDHPEDFDCLTHEFAHVIQNGWDGKFLEYSNYIEQFADACRYLYAMDGGAVNDRGWEMQTVRVQKDREKAVRFHVWYDYFYSTPGNDLLLKFFDVCRNGMIPTKNWDEAWARIFAGSELEGKTIDEIFALYRASDFALLPSGLINGESRLLEKYNVREKAAEIS